MKGTIKTLKTGFGFITIEGESKDVFFHATDLSGVAFDDLRMGDSVEFEMGESDKGPKAVNVSVAGAANDEM
jgi:CspA family cold shock protein